MNVLLVDDQKTIVDSLERGIRWERLPVEKVYTATSAMEARLVLVNFPVDVLVTDIEMPEEDGLSLCRWMKEHFPQAECIFLTSHAEFEYAKEAIRMGGYDYILQPVRYTDVEKVLLRVWEKISREKKISHMIDTHKMVMEQRNVILEAMLRRAAEGKAEGCDRLCGQFLAMYQAEYRECLLYPVLIRIVGWKKITETWEENLICYVLKNIFEEIFEQEAGRAGIIPTDRELFWVFLLMEKEALNEQILREKIRTFYGFIAKNMDFSIAVYPAAAAEGGFYSLYGRLAKRAERGGRHEGIFTEDVEEETDCEEDIIEKALHYIRKNLNRNISRADVAQEVHLNEEYFSRLFRQKTGATFKDVVMTEKMNLAKGLLTNTRYSVSIIASKVGYDNFSHFSKMFKKMTGFTPQEYRKETAGKEKKET